MHRGYVKLWRKSLESGLLQNAEAWQLMTWCLLKATHKPHKQLVGKQIVSLESGQFIFGRKKAASDLKSSEQKIRTSLKLLQDLDFLTIKSTNKYSIISVNNWGTYQAEDTQNNQQATNNPTNKQPTSNQQATTNKNVEEHKEKYSPEICDFVDAFQKYAIELHGNGAPEITKSSTKSACDTVDKLIRIDKWNLDTIKDCMRWAVKDEFWSDNARSLSQLRVKSKNNGLKKFQNIHNGWKKETGGRSEIADINKYL